MRLKGRCSILCVDYATGERFICRLQLIERGVTWLYDDAVVGIVKGAGSLLQRFNDGSLSRYLTVAVTGVAAIIILFLAIN